MTETLLFGGENGAGAGNAPGFSGYVPGVYNPLAVAEKGTGWSESFETEGVSWRPLFQQGEVRVADHRRTSDFFYSGKRSERVTLDFPNLGYAFLGHYVDYPILYDETAPTLRVRTDSGPVTLGMVVVLPKTIRSDTKTPLTFLLAGTTYSRIGEWEELSFPQSLRTLLEETVRAIRGEHKIPVNAEDAYIRQIVLFAEHSRGRLQIWTDDLKIAEHAPRELRLLEEEETDGEFNPINLLAFRFAATHSTIVLESALNQTRDWPEEPFRVGYKVESVKTALAGDRLLPWFKKGGGSYFGAGPSAGDSSAADYQSVESLAGESRKNHPVGFFDGPAGMDGGFDGAAATDSGIRPPQSGVIPSFDGSAVISGSGTRPVSGEIPDSFPVSAKKPFPSVKFSQKTLLIGDKEPLAIRAIEYQGERLAFLKSLRFNAVWLKTPPTRAILEEASQTGLWLIAPPPVGSETVPDNDLTAAAQTPVDIEPDTLPYFNRLPISDVYDPVLLWDLGTNLTEDKIKSVRSRLALVRGLDPHRRPIVCNVRSGLAEFTFGNNDLNLALLNRRPLLTSIDMADYGRWLRTSQNQATRGFPFWNEIQTQPDSQLLAQCRFFGSSDEMPALISYEQIRQQVRLSLGAEIHGLVFSSRSPLDADDRETQYRACALELVNLELLLIEPWFAGGTAEDLVASEESGISGVILRAERASLLLPISDQRENQLVFGQAAVNNGSFIVPVRDGYSADLLLPGNLRKIPSKRQAGGVRLDMEEVSMNSLVYLAQSEWCTRITAEKAPKLGKRMAELAIRLAKMRLDLYRQTLDRLHQLEEEGKIPVFGREPLLKIPEQETVYRQTCSALTLAEDYLRQDDPPEAYLQAERAIREIRLNERRFWELGTRKDLCRPVLPVSVSFATLPAYVETFDKIITGEIRVTGQNRLLGGDMERTEDWNTGKWMRWESPVPGVSTGLRRTPDAARQGSYGLELAVLRSGDQSPVELEAPPLRVEVPVAVRTGELLCVQGWFRISQEVEGSRDGFVIYDSQGGPALAQRYVAAADWTPFAFYRYASADGEMKLSFSLAGYGKVDLDDVSVHVVQ